MKTAKTIYLIVIILVTVAVVGFFGARRIRAFRGMFTDADIVKESVSLEPFKEIRLDADIADFTIVEGEEYRIDYEYPSNMTLKGEVDKETLKIELKGKKNNSFSLIRIDGNSVKTAEPKLKVVVPAGTDFEKVDLQIDAGNVTLSDRVIVELIADSDAGNFNLSKITAGKTNITADAGNIEIKDSTLGDCDLKTSAGRIKVDDSVMNSADAETSMGEIDFDNTTFEKGNIISDMGAVSVDGNFEELTCRTSLGKISVDSDSIDEAKLDLYMDMGDIKVNGESKGTEFKQN